ncbi:hypothetical protein Purlil1_6416 [Purpureocillium lilacinum]|uniref:Acyl-CoA dehydrogenase n=1 Tax=Purpureocillium lilacinum TaxID=33203 RepID=A0ABR0BZU6_PURLI|nr:hypothetical protein Purlil1_6416 [Purpureocillium lilacinum]
MLCLGGLAWNSRHVELEDIVDGAASLLTEFLQSQDPDLTDSQRTVREAIAKICQRFPDEYWLETDRSKTIPLELHAALACDGWLGICMPEAYGGSGLGIAEAAVMMQTIAESGGGMTAASAVHINIFGLEPVVRFGTEEQRRRFLRPMIDGKERACFAVTEPNTGLDTLKLQSLARRKGDDYILSGQKIWISTAQNAHKILILVRTTPLEQVKKPSEGLTLFYTDLNRDAVEITEIDKMGRAAVDTNQLFFDGWKVPAADRIGEEGHGFKMIMHGMNAERILIGMEALGLGFAALRRAATYAGERVVFGRPIGQNQAVQHPLADSWMNLEAARLLLMQAARMYDQGHTSGEYANAGKYLAAEAAFRACERAVMVHGGMGYAKEYHVERYLREVFVPRIAPVSREMILNYIGQRVLGLPKSY